MYYNKYQRTQVINFIDEIFSKDKRIKIEQEKKKRSIDQNSLYWLWVACVSQETGNSTQLLHETFKEMFLPFQTVNIFCKEKREYTSTTELDTAQFKKYLDNIQLFASENGIMLPNPEDLHWKEFEETYKNYL
jgi:hypothetical protein